MSLFTLIVFFLLCMCLYVLESLYFNSFLSFMYVFVCSCVFTLIVFFFFLCVCMFLCLFTLIGIFLYVCVCMFCISLL